MYVTYVDQWFHDSDRIANRIDRCRFIKKAFFGKILSKGNSIKDGLKLVEESFYVEFKIQFEWVEDDVLVTTKKMTDVYGKVSQKNFLFVLL